MHISDVLVGVQRPSGIRPTMGAFSIAGPEGEGGKAEILGTSWARAMALN